jgi:hypothetical protein
MNGKPPTRPIIPDLQPIDGLKYTADCTHTLVGKDG